jgi:rubrerythrin
MQMNKYKNKRSNINLESALAHNALSHVKYRVYGDQAELDGYPSIARSYRNAADKELEHAKIWMNEMSMVGSINENLQDSAVTTDSHGNREYHAYANDAENEGFNDLRTKFLSAAEVERNMNTNFNSMLDDYMSGEMFISPESSRWECTRCGYSE